MPKYYSIARPYAHAVFTDAQEHSQLTLWAEILPILAAVMTEAHAIEFVKNPRVSEQNRQQLLVEMAFAFAPKAAESLGERLKNFIALLAAENRLMQLPEISALYHELLLQIEATLEARVTSAYPLTEPQRHRLIQELEKRFKKRIKMQAALDPALIGGAIVQVNHWVLDGSVRGKLAELRKQLSI